VVQSGKVLLKKETSCNLEIEKERDMVTFKTMVYIKSSQKAMIDPVAG
jgi:hypothetical protein